MEPIIELKNVSGRKIEDVSMAIYPSDKIVLLGPSGGGKTTLLRFINLLETPRSGDIKYHGEAIDGHSYPQIRRKIVLLPQTPVVVDGTVLENVNWAHSFKLSAGSGVGDGDFMSCLNVVGIKHLADKPAEQLSGGEKQRLNLAMGFSIKPELMLLDEPTSALDPSASAGIHAVINRLHGKGVSFVIVTHSFAEAVLLADRIGIIIDGRLEQLDKKENVINNPITDSVKQFIISHRQNGS
ncbi:MAG: ATP-binding cassette domain-containing protein [candidate division Zixibacteria bacterium]|nr:ATP-binding cassette domain-containing protein [candidate division Zixibacteria bacterium]